MTAVSPPESRSDGSGTRSVPRQATHSEQSRTGKAQPIRHIVVGTDGSAAASPAVQWALEEAVRTGSRLTVLRVWEPVIPVGGPLLGTAVLDRPPQSDVIIAELDAEVDELHRRSGAADIRIDPVVLGGRPKDLLEEESRVADLLVVGSRGRGAVRGMLLGSVSQYLIAHATCPVVVVPSHT
jgi:nucleotide-binding universal stress UspA family protein